MSLRATMIVLDLFVHLGIARFATHSLRLALSVALAFLVVLVVTTARVLLKAFLFLRIARSK